MTTTIYRNAVVFTGAADEPTAEALAVREGRIVAAGALDAVRSAAGAGAAEVDLNGAFAMPGVIEAHVHLVMLGEALEKVQLRDCADLGEIQQRLLAARAAAPEARHLLGVSWMFDAIGAAQPTAAMIDAVIPDVPVLLDANDLHSVWVNSAALAAMGIDRDTPDPVGGEIVRDEHGDATGFLLETAAMQYAWGFIAEITSDEDRDRQLDSAFTAYLATGVTGATDMALDELQLAALRRRLDRDGRLPFPVTAHWLLQPSGDTAVDLAAVERAAQARDEIDAAYGSDWLRVAGVKFIMDGVIDACTAAMRAPYANGALPDPIWSLERARPVAIAADAAGLQLALHAIGDAASGIAVDLVEACLEANGPRAGRLTRLEHLESIGEDTIARMAELGIAASLQPVHCDPAIMENWMAMLGDERAERGFPWHLFREAGVPIALGTDAPTAPYDAAHNLFIALTAASVLDPTLEPYHPERVFAPAEALEAMTLGPARIGGIATDHGRIAAGYRANVAVFDTNLLTAPTAALLDARVQLTLVDGAVAYSA